MAMASGIFGITLRDVFDASAQPCELTGTLHKFQLVTDTYSPLFDTHSTETDITNEIGASGDYTAGGVAFTSPALAAAAGVLTLSASNDVLTSMTASNVEGRVCFDDNPTTPVADPLTFATDFGAPYDVTSGTLTIDNSNDLLTIDYTPV